MPDFKNKEEYEKWKNERLKNNLEKIQGEKKEEEPEMFQIPSPKELPSSSSEELTSLNDLFNKSWEIFKQRLGTLISLHLLSIFLMLIIVGFFLGIGFLFSFFFPEIKTISIAIAAFLGVALGFTIMFWGMAGFVFAVTDSSLGITDALKKGWHRIGAFIWLFSILGFIISGGFLLFFIPGVLFLVWFSFAQFILAEEDERGMNAVLKSKEYVRGRWFDVFLRLLVIWLVSIGVSMIPFIGPFLSILFFPFVMIFTYLIYQDLKQLKGKDFAYLHSAGEKCKWIAAGALGYIIMPLLIMACLGAIISVPLLMLKGILGLQGADIIR